MVVVMVELPNRSCATLWCTPLLSCVLLYFSPAQYATFERRSRVYATIEESTKDMLPADKSPTGFTGQ